MVNRQGYLPYRVDAFISEFAVGSFSPSNLWGLLGGVARGLEREEGQGVSGQARGVKWRRDSQGSAGGSPLGHLWPTPNLELGDLSLGDPVTHSQLGMGVLFPGSSGPKSVLFVWLRF